MLMDKKVVFCNCQGKIVEPAVLDTIRQTLEKSGQQVIVLTDLCGMAATNPGEVQPFFAGNGEIHLVACYPRAVKLLLQNCGVNTSTANINYINLRENPQEAIGPLIKNPLSGNNSSWQPTHRESEKDWPAWYPAIDYQRCVSCGQCADFCLFGVYENNGGKVKVVNPKGCKNNCPACARICPHTAIVFPKYEQGGAIAGSDMIDETAEHQRQLRDVDDILGSDIYKALEARKAKRRSIISTDAMQQAINEREKALKENSRNQ